MKKEVMIGKRKVGLGNPVFIIAEAGVNHNGSVETAKKLIDAAKKAGADAVKFQTFNAEELATRNAPKAAYQKKTVPGKSQFDMLKSLELSDADFKSLFAYCRKKNVLFLSTPFNIASADLLFGLGMKAFKISSGDLTNIPMLVHIAALKLPMILSTGMATLQEVKEAVRAVYAAGNRELVLLHCTSNYPAKPEDVNLLAMDTMSGELQLPVGYSDHTEGPEIAVASAARGACVIEKHLTLSRKMNGPDHGASMEPEELREMVLMIRRVERALGSGIKEPRRSEEGVKKAARKSIVAGSDIFSGKKIALRDMAFKRPGTGISPEYYKKIVGKTAKRDIKKDSLISWSMIK